MKPIILIEQLSSSEANIISESIKDSKNNVFLSGVFMQAEARNRNGRIYPLSEMVSAVKSINEHIQEYKGLFGELDHPADRLNIAMDRISHVITELYMNGNNAIGKAKLLDTPMGLIAKEIDKSGARYGVSSRGAGNVNESGMVSGFRIVTVDLVATPSAHGAMPSSIYESARNHKEDRIFTLNEAVRHDPDAQKFLQKEIKQFVSNILKFK